MAAIDPIVIELEGKIENPGESLPVAGTVSIDGYEVGEKHFDLPEGIAYDAVLTNAGDGILLTGMVRAHAVGTCDRCLDPAAFDIAGELQEYYLFEEPEGADEDEDYELLPQDRKLDLAQPIADAVVMETPFQVLCRPDCAGLCPTCGCNLNYETCDCDALAEAERIEGDDNPFAALKALKFDE